MMDLQIPILVYGHDPVLLETRQMILQAAGYAVTTVSKLSKVGPFLCSGKFNLLILCHSLSSRECECALAIAKSQAPSTASLVLSIPGLSCSVNVLAEVLNAMEGPAKLLSTVKKITHRESNAPTLMIS